MAPSLTAELSEQRYVHRGIWLLAAVIFFTPGAEMLSDSARSGHCRSIVGSDDAAIQISPASERAANRPYASFKKPPFVSIVNWKREMPVQPQPLSPGRLQGTHTCSRPRPGAAGTSAARSPVEGERSEPAGWGNDAPARFWWSSWQRVHRYRRWVQRRSSP